MQLFQNGIKTFNKAIEICIVVTNTKIRIEMTLGHGEESKVVNRVRVMPVSLHASVLQLDGRRGYTEFIISAFFWMLETFQKF